MEQNGLPSFGLPGAQGQMHKRTRKTKQGLSRAFLLDTLKEPTLLDSLNMTEEDVEKIVNHIYDSRKTTEKKIIERKLPKIKK